jgi:glyoxylase-like metal-dependent hydrolase (beta-lactamase superfamily II)
LEAVSLWDGGFLLPNNGRVIGVDEGPAKVSEVLKAAGVPTETLELSINVLLLKTPGRIWLFDTGNGPKSAGRLMESLQAAGVQPAQVTDVVISHSHGDHVNGLLTAAGAPAFPKAQIRLTAAEWAHMKAQPALAAMVKAIEPQVETFQPGARLSPEVTAVEVRGHTPGHSAYLIESGGQRLLAIGDTAHHYIVSVRHPEFTIQFDADAPTAEASRRALLKRAADQNLSVFAPHFPYPGLGAVRPEADGFAWVPRR